MGRSNRCFKIITCGGDSAAEKDDIDIQAPENKGSSDKRGWSFRKRSARHRVLSNNVTSESPSAANKESIEPASLSYQQQDTPSLGIKQDTPSVPEKISVVECIDEKPSLPIPVEEKAPKTVTLDKDEKEDDAHVEESVVIILQSAARAFMAKKELVRLKSVVKLQAAVRGHLVRQRAVGSLRCVQAIAKMQVFVRARHARNRGSNVDDGKDGKMASSKTSKTELSIATPTVTYTSLEKLLSNRFARQLMGSTPKSRPMNIKCDPLRPNSSWVWFERWTSASSVEPTPRPEPTPTPKSFPEKVEEEEKQEEQVVEPERSLMVEDSRSHIEEAVSSLEIEENLITYDASDPKFKGCQTSTHPGGDNLEQPQGEVDIPSDGVKEASVDSNALPSQTLQSDVHDQPGQECEQPEPPKRSSMKRLASDELETEGKKFVYGSRKVSSPAFVAAQSKFEHGLGSTTDSNKRSSQVPQDARPEVKQEKASAEETLAVTKDPRMTENSVTHISTGQYGDSECGTELSVTSTLDSPDVSEAGAAEPEHKQEVKTSVQETYHFTSSKSFAEEFKDASEDALPSPSNPAVTTQPEELHGAKSEAAITNSVPSPEEQADREQEEAERYPEATSPTRSQVTVPGESHGTPASQVSVTKSEKHERKSSTSQKRKSLSAGNKKPAASPQNESNTRSSGKRRNSFGSPKRDDTATTTNDQEPRPSNSSSSSTVPRFMQVTESARAKLQANNSSPRSSPDVNDREYIKKRHSLPGANGRHGSPRIQRTTSQTQPASKSGEKKWQR